MFRNYKLVQTGLIAFTISMFCNQTFSQVTLEEPIFSAKRGFYEDSFELVISSAQEGVKINYSLDGSNPRNSSSAIKEASLVTIHINPEDTTGRDKAPGVVVRACAVKDNSVFSVVVTHTFLFINKVKTLSPDGQKPGPVWPDPNDTDIMFQYIDYGMDPDVLNDHRYRNYLDDALVSIPSISLVTDLNNLFHPDSGIYVNAEERGKDWERKTSIELLHPDGSEGFQVNAGLRIRGGWFRHNYNPKHAFRFFFRAKYGPSKLRYPMFGEEGTDSFDKLDLRISNNFSWSAMGDPTNTMNRDVFSRDTQQDMGQPYTRSRYYHLYINGTYWGLYQTQEQIKMAIIAESARWGDAKNERPLTKGDDWLQVGDFVETKKLILLK